MGTPSFRLRAATPADHALLPVVEARAAAALEAHGFAPADIPPPLPATHYAGLAAPHDLTLAVADQEGPIAFALSEVLDGEAHLAELSVDRAHQGRGLGGLLLGRAVDWARGQGFGAITLTTFRDVPFNAPFYARRGFSIVTPDPARWPDLAARHRRDSATAIRPRVVMIRRLGGKAAAGGSGSSGAEPGSGRA